jgi:guanylate kinase
MKKHNPLVLVVSGSSGAGKDTVIDALMKRHRNLVHITTATTRAPRENEIDGVSYYFKTEKEFKTLIEHNELLEYAHVYDKWYGVPKQPVRDALASDKIAIIKVDVQGAMTIKGKLPDAVLLFIMPPRIEDIINRLKARGTETEEQLKIRFEAIKKEYETLPEFNYMIINADGKVDEAVEQIEKVIRSERRSKKIRNYDLSSGK